MSKYKILSKNHYKSNNYTLCTIREKDIEKIRVWRNKQINILRQNNPISKQQQINYYNDEIKKSITKNEPNVILFSFLINQKCIGYGGFVHIDWKNKRAEISFLTDPARMNARLYEKDFSLFLDVIFKIGFKEIGFNKLTTETFEIRPKTMNILEQKGFKKEGLLKDHVKVNGKYVNSIIHGILKKDVQKSNKQKLNILVTSISKKVSLIESIKNVGLKMNEDVKVIGADSNKLCIGKYFVDEFWHMPPLKKLTLKKLIDYCKMKKISVIIPTRDAELIFFAKNKETLNKNKIFVMVSSEKTIKLCNNKLDFYKKLSTMGLPVIKTSVKINDLNCKRYVVKEKFGAGSQKIALDLNKTHALLHSKNMENPVFQPHIAGKEFSVDLYVDKKGKSKGCIVRRRDLIKNGESQISTVIENKKIEKICVEIVEKVKFYGHIVFQIILDKKNKVNIIECNCRFGGASTLSLASGLDSFYWFLLEVKKENLNRILFKIKSNKKQIRYPKDLVI
ncbi:GNAT family N-acetyltransferase [Nitrosopumilus sp.]|uniref:GNAT family N-acetyltransferase n=1 Tax=Nitrosopumilus sp. TaxID=2024843 RepID=UPI003D1371D4